MYCGASLGRVGMDFRPLLVPLFESAVVELFKKVGGWLGAGWAAGRAVAAQQWGPAGMGGAAEAGEVPQRLR